MKLSITNFLLLAVASNVHGADPVIYLDSLDEYKSPAAEAIIETAKKYESKIPQESREVLVEHGIINEKGYGDLALQIYSSGIIRESTDCARQSFGSKGEYNKPVCQTVKAVIQACRKSPECTASKLPSIVSAKGAILEDTRIVATALCIKNEDKPRNCNDYSFVEKVYKPTAIQIADIISEIDEQSANPLWTWGEISPASISKIGEKPIQVIGDGAIEIKEEAIGEEATLTQKKADIILEVMTTMISTVYAEEKENDTNQNLWKPISANREPISNVDLYKGDYLSGVMVAEHKPDIVPRRVAKDIVSTSITARPTRCAVSLGILTKRFCGYDISEAKSYFDYYLEKLPQSDDTTDVTTDEFFCSPFTPEHYEKADRMFRRINSETRFPNAAAIDHERCTEILQFHSISE